MDNEASSVDVAVSGICCNEQRSAAKHPRRFTAVGPMRISHVVMTYHDHIAQRCVEMWWNNKLSELNVLVSWSSYFTARNVERLKKLTFWVTCLGGYSLFHGMRAWSPCGSHFCKTPKKLRHLQRHHILLFSSNSKSAWWRPSDRCFWCRVFRCRLICRWTGEICRVWSRLVVLSAPAYDVNHRKTLQPDTASISSSQSQQMSRGRQEAVTWVTITCRHASCHASRHASSTTNPKLRENRDENGCFMFVGTSHRIVIYPTCLSDLSAVNLCQAAPSLAGQISQRSEAQANGRKDSLASSTCWAPLWFPCCNGAGDGFLNDFGPQHRHIPPHSVE